MENKNIRVNLVYADGSARPATISASAIDFVTRTARMLPCLFEGTGFNPLNADVSNIVAVTRTGHDVFHQISHAQWEREATKRRLIELFDRFLFPDYENDLLADDFIASGVTFSDFTQIQYDSGRIIGEKQAIFRLGQMDMKESIIDMLQHHVDQLDNCLPRATLQAAIDEIRKMEVSNEDT